MDENTNLPNTTNSDKGLMYMLMMQQAAMNSQNNMMYHLDERNRHDDKLREERNTDKQNQFFAMLFLFLIVFLFGFSALLILFK